MKKNVKSSFVVTGLLLLLFVIFTVVVSTVDVKPIGPEGSEVGLATLNGFVFQKLGVHMIWYSITDRLGVVALLTAFCFAIIGLIQIVNKKSLLKVDIRIILLGIYYVIVIAAYVFFEIFIINYRPIILEESVGLEASYPSSHTMLVICIMGSANVLFQQMIQNKMIRVMLNILSSSVIVVTAVGRMVSGVHWFTDIVGGMLLGITMIQLYASVLQLIAWKKENNKEI